jgi:hypothetical protein
MILKVETADGKQSASLLYSPPPPALPGNAAAQARKPVPIVIRDFRQQGDEVSFVVAQGAAVRTFVGTIGSDPKRIRGSLGTDAAAARTVLTATDKDTFTAPERLVRSPAAEAFTSATQLALKSRAIQARARAEKDEEKKAQLLKEAAEALKDADANLPTLYRDVISKFRDEPAAMDVAVALVGLAGKTKAGVEDVAGWVAVVEKQSTLYGPRFAKPVLTQVADTLADAKEYAPIAVRLAEPMVKALKETDRASDQVKYLTILKTALEAAGRTAELKPIEARL